MTTRSRLAAWTLGLVAVSAATAAAAALAVVGASPAAAAACSGAVRFAATSNRLYVESGSQTPSSILALCPGVPLVLVDPANKVWQLNADLQVENGATLALHGTAVGGDVNELRLKSASTVTGTPGKIRLARSTATTLTDNTLPSGIGFALTSAAGAPTDATVRSSAGGPRPTFKATVDAGSALSVVTADGRLSGVSVPTPTALSSSAATLKLPVSTSSLTVTAQPMGATVASGAATARPVSVSATSKTIGLTPSAVGQRITWSMSGFTAGTKYVVRTGGTKTGTATADASGTVSATLAATGTTEVQIKVSAT